MKKLTYLFIISAVLFACGSSEEKSEKSSSMTSRDEIRLKQYQVQGAKVYATYCANCHQQDGKGLASLYPPLAGSDYLLEDMARAACIVKNGQSKEIVVNGVTYNQMMPGNPISNLEIAEVLTFIGNAWGNEAGLIGVKDVDQWIEACE
ncbi:c-type cytochrome [Ekhidna sp. To15]|uniref:c-type cytochrome n=1 Tax=Ekhidna sp. To15 TaxID=3395267 RepID=UPI003F520960